MILSLSKSNSQMMGEAITPAIRSGKIVSKNFILGKVWQRLGHLK
jgi:hypothetical protein